jgi:glyoxylase-like metal-dependent hydrolase (beta-lactamase superfamily II)
MKRLFAAFALFVAACASGKPAETRLPPPAVRLYAMDCGRIDMPDVDALADDGSMRGVAAARVDPCYLVRHPRGDLIWDTGLPETIADMPDGLNTPPPYVAHFTVSGKLPAYLGELGMRPADIEYLALSHRHFDHSGNANVFAGATWIVNTTERDAMFSDAGRASPFFSRYADLEHIRTIRIEGDSPYDVFGDGSVVIYQAPGHTEGHAVLLVKTAQSGAVILSGDLWQLPESRARRLVPRSNFNREMTLASMDMVEALAVREHARIIRQHVTADFESLPRIPNALE